MSAGTLYEQAMGASFERLALSVQRFHRLAGRHELRGWVETDAPVTLAAKALALCLGTPLTTSSGPIRFELDASAERERWIRRFPSKTTASTLRVTSHHIVERLGLACLWFELHEVDGSLEMRLCRLSFLGVPCPAPLLPRVVATEVGDADTLRFRIEASLPLIGRVAGYRGHLVVP